MGEAPEAREAAVLSSWGCAQSPWPPAIPPPVVDATTGGG